MSVTFLTDEDGTLIDQKIDELSEETSQLSEEIATLRTEIGLEIDEIASLIGGDA